MCSLRKYKVLKKLFLPTHHSHLIPTVIGLTSKSHELLPLQG